ncbi:hypothetical protein Slala03_21270 [Streptomyces lavendulae subsp. lavendulae]|nr:hypothetical protein Slala03_21270 [Streptomyces lavendulae subsp. lavendulae]
MPLLGARIERRENLVAAWFGPQGFASVVYASSYSRPGRHRARRLLAAVIDERHPDALAEGLAGRTVAEWLPRRTFKPLYVGPDAGILQIAAVMPRAHVPLVAVVERDIGGERGPLLGVVTAAALMRYFLAAGDQA